MSSICYLQPYSANSANILWNNSLFLEALQTSHLLPMKAAAQRLRAAASALEQRVRFNQSSLPEAIEMLIEQADAAQKFLRSQGPQELTKVSSPSLLIGLKFD
jgi:prominin 1